MSIEDQLRERLKKVEALYFGAKLNDQSLVPGPNPHLGSIRFDWWLTHVPPQKK